MTSSPEHTPTLGRRQSDAAMGLHINPIRSSSSASTRFFNKSGSSATRSISNTPFLTSSPTSPTTDDVFEDQERTPLINKNLLAVPIEEPGQESLTGSFGSLIYPALENARKKGKTFWLNSLKILVLFGICILCCTAFVRNPEFDGNMFEIIASRNPQVFYNQSYNKDYPILYITIMGPVFENDSNSLDGDLQIVRGGLNINDSDKWHLQINKTLLRKGATVELYHQFPCPGPDDCELSLQVTNNVSDVVVPLVYTVQHLSRQIDNEIIYAALILAFVYTLIVFELVHRTLAAMLGALAALAVLSAINERPSTEQVIDWMEMDTLMLLFGMMIIVAVVADTGIFDFCALKAYKLAKGKVWPLVTLLCLFSAIVSAFLDNVTTILLMTPVTIRLCEVLNLEPRVILIAEVLFSNIGGTATAIGDPPNVIIVGQLEDHGITFTVFTAHLFVGIIFITAAAYGFMRVYYRKMDQLSKSDPPEIAELNHQIDMWRRAASRLVVVTKEETLMKALFLQKAVELENLLNKTLHRKRKAEQNDRNEQLRQLEREYQIKDAWLLMKCGFVLIVVLVFFFMYSFVTSIHIGLGWIAVIGAMWLLVLSDYSDLENVLHKVEWSTLLFFSALFILMEALAELQLMEWIGERMRDMIVQVDTEYRMTAALVIIVWISALASSFIDNIPYTTAMIPVLRQLSDDKEVNLHLLPLVMALAFGACLGGNGTLIGASANVVCAGIAEQHGYPISFKEFFKVGFPMMLTTTLVATVYLLICHSAIGWDG